MCDSCKQTECNVLTVVPKENCGKRAIVFDRDTTVYADQYDYIFLNTLNGSFTLTILDPKIEPIAGVFVQLYYANSHTVTISTKAGEFELNATISYQKIYLTNEKARELSLFSIYGILTNPITNSFTQLHFKGLLNPQFGAVVSQPFVTILSADGQTLVLLASGTIVIFKKTNGTFFQTQIINTGIENTGFQAVDISGNGGILVASTQNTPPNVQLAFQIFNLVSNQYVLTSVIDIGTPVSSAITRSISVSGDASIVVITFEGSSIGNGFFVYRNGSLLQTFISPCTDLYATISSNGQVILLASGNVVFQTFIFSNSIDQYQEGSIQDFIPPTGFLVTPTTKPRLNGNGSFASYVSADEKTVIVIQRIGSVWTIVGVVPSLTPNLSLITDSAISGDGSIVVAFNQNVIGGVSLATRQGSFYKVTKTITSFPPFDTVPAPVGAISSNGTTLVFSFLINGLDPVVAVFSP